MTVNWQLSGSEPATSAAYDLLHPSVRRWVWRQGWPDLRDIQEQAIPLVTAAEHDLIIAAATASGKTEAAFLPICSTMMDPARHKVGIRALYISPLKALINDQWRRLDNLCEVLDLSVHRWHGDVTAAAKAKVFARPSGILLITPESLEALFVLRGPRLAALFSGLDWLVIDELHSFMGTKRGAQLRSLLHRLELTVRRRVPRIGLSATLGDMAAAAEFLRPGGGHGVELIESRSDHAEVRLRIQGYLNAAPPDPRDNHLTERDSQTGVIAEHLFSTMRERNHLIFVNGRRDAEIYADRLRAACELYRVPNQFFPHHGNLAKDVREDVEERLKGTLSTTAICTSTLEMGIDIGAVDSVGQIGSPPTVASLRQRLGRSGRRGSPAVLRMYVTENEITERTPVVDQLRAEVTQAVAMVDLLRNRWYEPPDSGSPHLSTLVQQVLSVIAQHQGAHTGQLWTALCERGPFNQVDKTRFMTLLRDLGQAELIQQEKDGLLLLGRVGELIVNHFSFYAAFATTQEFRLVTGTTTLGTVPVNHAITIGQTLIFAGRRWEVLNFDDRLKQIEVIPANQGLGQAPRFGGGFGAVHDMVRQRMRRWYESDEHPAYLDPTAGRLLDDGRRCYRRLRLNTETAVAWGRDTVIFPWLGDRVLDTIAVWLRSAGLRADRDGISVTVAKCTPAELTETVRLLLDKEIPTSSELAATVANTTVNKYDEYLSPALRAFTYGHSCLDVPGAIGFLKEFADLGTP